MQQASTWLSVVVPAILTTKTFETDASATVMITVDEPTTGTYGTTPVYFVVAGPGAKLHYSSSTKFTHLNLLATIESNWSLRCVVSGNDCGVAVMSEFLAGAVSPPSSPGGVCLQCLLNNLSSSTLLLLGLAVGLTLAASAVILARRRSHPAIPAARRASESSQKSLHPAENFCCYVAAILPRCDNPPVSRE
jgi:hypothetical protein